MDNVYDIYKNNSKDLKSYVGIEQFVDTTMKRKEVESGMDAEARELLANETFLRDGMAGTYTVDEDFEEFVKRKFRKIPESPFYR